MYFIFTFNLMFILWIMLSAKFDAFHLGLGVISSLIVAYLSNDLLFQDKEVPPFSRLSEGFRFTAYTFWLLYQIMMANIHVVSLALSLRPINTVIQPEIITFKTKLKSDFARFVLANSITLTPGTVTIRIVDDMFYVHAITSKAAGDLPGDEAVSEMERRIAWVFEK